MSVSEFDPQAGPDPQSASPREEPASPCVSVCALDDNDICMGCYRSADEITDWFMASNEQKHTILERANRRRDEDSPIRLL